ncbi:hypothetical protein NWI74_000267 [Salmonella enterica]|nr:hypothetical protein [Salmonella enterica]EJS8594049.1 hypothetical protein [Salmonella enterica]EKS2346375.1 hypothetical protein [Salmonella enterica]
MYNSQPLPQYLRPGIFAEALPVKWQPSPDEQVLLSGHEALGAVDDSIEQEEDYTRFSRMKRGNLYFWKLSCLWIFSRFYEWQSAALRLSSPDLPPA